MRTGNLACPTVDLLACGKETTVAAVIPPHTPRPAILRNGGPAWTGILARLAPELWPGINRNTQAEAANLRELHAKIGQQALEIDFLAGALGRHPGPSARR
ncbi:MAG: hypothetical protein IT484_11360 [Gammaproteobacteria bacterium]|nr:hypothetical protein [Gammaproteobacteria bacterium]